MPELFVPGYQFLDNSGSPVNAGTVTFYESGTTTSKDIFTDPDLTTAATNPASLDSAGRFSSGSLYGNGLYTVVLKNSGGTTIWSRDNYLPSDAIPNGIRYELSVSAKTRSHPSDDGFTIVSQFYDADQLIDSGSSLVWTGNTDAAKKQNWPDDDGYFYDDDGKQFAVIGPINVQQFGAKGDGTTDDATAFQAAINGAVGGIVGVPQASDPYILGATIKLDVNGTRLIGESGANPRLHGSLTNGPVVRVMADNCVIENMVIGSNSTRESSSASGNYGILHEPPAGSNQTNFGCIYRNITIQKQPSHGIVMCSGFMAASLASFQITCCKGHGVLIDNGTEVSRPSSQLNRAGGVDIRNGVISKNGGHSFQIGTPGISGNLSYPASSAYRISVFDVDCFSNGNTETDPDCSVSASELLKDYDMWILAESSRVELCAFGGEDTLGGIYVQGVSVSLANNRYVEVATTKGAVAIDSANVLRTEGILVSELYVEDVTAALNPAVQILGTEVSNTLVESRNIEDITLLVTQNESTESVYGTYRELAGEVNAFQFATGTTLDIDNEAVATLEFTGPARGIIMVSGNVDEGGAAVAHFRVDDNLHCKIMAKSITGIGADVVGTTGVLTGTSGSSGDLTISAAADKKIYIENRTGATRSYRVSLQAVAGGSLAV